MYSPPESDLKILIPVENWVPGLKNRQDLRFGPKEIDPSIPTEIIDECHKIFISSMRDNRRNAPYITMHNIKAFFGTITMRREQKSLTFTKFAYRTVK